MSVAWVWEGVCVVGVRGVYVLRRCFTHPPHPPTTHPPSLLSSRHSAKAVEEAKAAAGDVEGYMRDSQRDLEEREARMVGAWVWGCGVGRRAGRGVDGWADGRGREGGRAAAHKGVRARRLSTPPPATPTHPPAHPAELAGRGGCGGAHRAARGGGRVAG